MTLLSICKDAAYEVQIAAPATIVGNTSTDALRFFRYANKVGIDLMKRFTWQDLRTEKTFTALGQSEQTSILPSDFDRFVPETFWDRTNQILVSGPVPPVRWNGLKASSYDGAARRFIYRGDSIFVIPVFDGGESLAFEYVSKNWAQSSGGTPQEKFQADTDVSVINEELITLGVVYRWLLSEDQPYQEVKREFEDKAWEYYKTDQSAPEVLVAGDIFARNSRHFTGEPQIDGSDSVV